MIDIKLFRENPDIIRESEKKRFKDPSRVDEVIKYDKLWRESIQKIDLLRHEKNKVSMEISQLKREGKSADLQIRKMREINDSLKDLESKVELYLQKRDSIRYTIGNILHASVPIGESEDDSKEVRKWGNIESTQFKPISHVDLLTKRGLIDMERAAKISGARFYYLKGDLLKLNLALINYALDSLIEEGFMPIQTPYIMRKEYMKKAAELGDFEETLYKLADDESFLIATSEQPLASMHANEMLLEDELPLKYAGYSTNFRKEAGSHGKDTKGIFRVHQFDKVEQYVISLPENSWEWHEKMTSISEKIIQGLELPYRVIDIASGDMNDNAARKYDIEVWMPVQEKYRELVSASNTTDYQPRKLGIRVLRRNGEKQVPHTLNSTGIAVQRAIVAIVENHQQEDGRIRIPNKLRPYINKEYI